MTEDEAREWIAAGYGSESQSKLGQIARIVETEAARQNLIARSTLAAVWARHIVDSAQLLNLSDPIPNDGLWIDIGSGAGFPGLVVAALADFQVILVEPRRRRAEFLAQAVVELGLSATTSVQCRKIEAVNVPATIISARAVAPLTNLFDWASGCATPTTQWVLPKGRTAREEVATAQQAWHGVFHVEHSVTDPDSLIVLASGVTRR